MKHDENIERLMHSFEMDEQRFGIVASFCKANLFMLAEFVDYQRIILVKNYEVPASHSFCFKVYGWDITQEAKLKGATEQLQKKLERIIRDLPYSAFVYGVNSKYEIREFK